MVLSQHVGNSSKDKVPLLRAEIEKLTQANSLLRKRESAVRNYLCGLTDRQTDGWIGNIWMEIGVIDFNVFGCRLAIELNSLKQKNLTWSGLRPSYKERVTH